MGAGPLCCISAKAQYKNKPQTQEAPTPQNQEQLAKKSPPFEEISVASQNYTSSQVDQNAKSLVGSNEKNNNNILLQISKEGSKTMESKQEQKVTVIQPKAQDIIPKNENNINQQNNEAMVMKDKINKQSFAPKVNNNNETSLSKNQISVIQATNQKVKEGSINSRTISRINATLRSSIIGGNLMGSQNDINERPRKGKKKKGKKKKSQHQQQQQSMNENQNQNTIPQRAIPHQSYFGNSNTTVNNQNKTKDLNNESKSIDFQVTYIERKQESFYRKGNNNVTNFLKSTNITDVNLQALKNTKFINQKSVGEEERLIINDLIGKEQKVINLLDNSAPNQSQNYMKKKQSFIPNNQSSNITQKGHPNNIAAIAAAVQSPYFQESQDDDIMTTKQEQQIKGKQYPIIDDIDEYSIDPHMIKESQNMNGEDIQDQFDDDDHQEQDEETYKEEISPNEACYIEVEPIEPNALIPLNDSLARQRAIKYKQTSRFVNGMIFDIWDKNIHEKIKFYTGQPSFVDEKMIEVYKIYENEGIIWKRITEISMNPGIMKEKLRPSKVFAGEQSFEATICAITSVINHDIKFSTDFIGQALYPHNNNKPIQNNFGKYSVKLNLNGENRVVELDDLILYNTKKKALSLCYYEKDPNEFSLALLEKAFIKVYGGVQTMIEANPSIDIHFLTNWIPETVHFDDVSNKDNLWSRLLQNFRDQNIIICLQTANSQTQQLEFFSVLDLIETHDMRIIQCKAPYKGTKNLMRFMKEAERLPQPFKREQGIALETGVFYVVWTDEIIKYFNSISLCWNTKIYPFSQCVISKFPVAPSQTKSKYHDENFCLYNKPQILFTIPPHQEDFEVRIMLRRHVKDYQQRNTISFKLFTFDGHRIVYPMETLRTFQYPTREICSDVFIFENSVEYESYALVLTAEDESTENCYEFFTLDVFSFINLDLKELPILPVDKTYSVEGLWRCEEDSTLIGGSILSHKFVYNPQYKLQVSETTHVQIKCETDPFNSVMLMLYESGLDATEAPFQSILSNKNQGFFFKGFSYLETILEPKEYTVVLCPQYQQQVLFYFVFIVIQQGDYKIDITKIVSAKYDYTKDFIVKELKVKNYKYKTEIDGKWTFANSKGTNRILTDEFQAFMKNPGYVIKVREQTNTRCQLVPTDPIVEGHEIPSVSICIFEILDHFKFRIIQEDDHYAGRAWGYYTEEIVLQPNKNGYLFLCINFDRGAEGNFKFCFNSDQRIDGQIKDFTDIFYKKNTEHYVGQWSNELNTAGGCSQEPSFYKNPQYVIQVKKNTNALFQIESQDQYPVGLVLFEIDQNQIEQNSKQQTISQMDQKILSQNPKSNQTFLIEINNLITPLKANKQYIIVPATYKAGQEGKFILTASMDEEFSVSEMRESQLSSTQKIKGRFETVPRGYDDPLQVIDRLPHFWFSLSQKTDIRLQIYSSEEIGLRLMVYQIIENGMQIIKEISDFSQFRIGSILYIKDLKPSQFGYIILCEQNDPTFSGEFSLLVESNQGSIKALIKDYLLQESANDLQKGSQGYVSARALAMDDGQQLAQKKPRKVIKKSSIIRKPQERINE